MCLTGEPQGGEYLNPALWVHQGSLSYACILGAIIQPQFFYIMSLDYNKQISQYRKNSKTMLCNQISIISGSISHSQTER